MIVTKRRADLGKKFTEIVLIRHELVGPDAERWDIEYSSGVRAREHVDMYKAATPGLARWRAEKLAQSAHKPGRMEVDVVIVREYIWVENDFDDNMFGYILDAEPVQISEQTGYWDTTHFNWDGVEECEFGCAAHEEKS